jgi:hypothetical protein
MNKELQKIHDKLIECNLGDAVRVSILNPNSEAECLLCFLLLTDRFKSFDDLLLAIRNCLQEMSVRISDVNDSRITIMAI